jgi:hypothetical protein
MAEALLHSRRPLVRQLFRGLRDMLVVGYYEQPVVQDRLGYQPDMWVTRVATAREQQWGEAIAAHEALLAERHPLPRVGEQ